MFPLSQFDIGIGIVAPPSGWRSLPPAQGSCAPTLCAAHRRSQKPPVLEIGRNWSRLVEIGRDWSRLVAIGRNWSQLVEIGRGWSRLIFGVHLHRTLWYEVAEVALGKLLAVRRDQRMLVFPVTKIIIFGGFLRRRLLQSVTNWSSFQLSMIIIPSPKRLLKICCR